MLMLRPFYCLCLNPPAEFGQRLDVSRLSQFAGCPFVPMAGSGGPHGLRLAAAGVEGSCGTPRDLGIQQVKA